MNKSQATREKLCETAIEIAAREGLAAMTLDNVARHAGVSKGGVTYHFPSKDKLLEAVVEHFGERLERLVLERVANDPHPRHRWARAMLDCTFDEPAAASSTGAKTSRPTAVNESRSRHHQSPQPSSLGASRLGVRPADWPDQMLEPLIIERFFLAVLAAATTQPGVIAPLRAVGHRVRERLLADPRDGFDQLLLWLALDGLLLWQFAGLIDRADPLFAQVGRELRARVDAGFPPGLMPTTTPDNNASLREPSRSERAETGPPLAPVAASTDPLARAANTEESPAPGRRAKRNSRSVLPAHSDPPAVPARPSPRRNRSS
ncbi:MAG: TetR/AcrR family transcriptional regulator [Planctomycetaceae bacterium]